MEEGGCSLRPDGVQVTVEPWTRALVRVVPPLGHWEGFVWFALKWTELIGQLINHRQTWRCACWVIWSWEQHPCRYRRRINPPGYLGNKIFLNNSHTHTHTHTEEDLHTVVRLYSAPKYITLTKPAVRMKNKRVSESIMLMSLVCVCVCVGGGGGGY